jgi:hypothetical protein
MKLLAIVILLVALFLLYRIARQKQPEKEKRDDIPQKRDMETKTDTAEVVGKSRFVSGSQRHLRQTPSAFEKPAYQLEKEPIFAPGNEKTSAVIPSRELDEVFSSSPQPMAIDYPPERIEDEPEDEATGEPDAEEEAGDILLSLGRNAGLADGFTYEEMAAAIETSNNPVMEGEKAQAAGEVFYRMEKTDLFEQLVSGDAGRAARIAAVLDLHGQSPVQEETKETGSDNTYGDFDIAEYLS